MERSLKNDIVVIYQAFISGLSVSMLINGLYFPKTLGHI